LNTNNWENIRTGNPREEWVTNKEKKTESGLGGGLNHQKGQSGFQIEKKKHQKYVPVKKKKGGRVSEILLNQKGALAFGGGKQSLKKKVSDGFTDEGKEGQRGKLEGCKDHNHEKGIPETLNKGDDCLSRTRKRHRTRNHIRRGIT